MRYLRLLLLPFVLGFLLLGCDKVDIEPDKSAEPFEINEGTGTMRYRDVANAWCILLDIPGTIDTYAYFYSGEVKKSFKREGLRVKFSGKAVESTFEEPSGICCVSYYCIDITNMEELK